MEWQQEHQVPVVVGQNGALTGDYLLKGGHKCRVGLSQLLKLVSDVSPEMPDRGDIVVDFVVLAGHQKCGNLVQDDETGLHELFSEHVPCSCLTHGQVVLVDNLDCNVDGFSSLLKLDAHLVHSVNDSFTSLGKAKAEISFIKTATRVELAYIEV